MNDENVLGILVKENYITEEDLKKATQAAARGDTSPIDYLLSHDLLSRDLLGQAIAESFQMPYADFNTNPPAPELTNVLPEEVAKKFRAVVFSVREDAVVVATDNPTQETLAQSIAAAIPGKRVTLAYALPDDVTATLQNYRKPLATRFTKIIEEKGRIAPEIIEQIFADALSVNASDIHLEPNEKEVVIRFRVDGVLQEVGRIPREYYENILNRIKVQSHLRIDEHFIAQDGALTYEGEALSADLRVSIVPTVEGEKVVFRVLAAYVQGFSLSDLGLSDADQKLVEKAAAKPFGMILATGPTGSGKTTTLYALLKMLNQPEVNITTIEDPVEYKVAGVNQIQVNAETRLTFAEGLRSIVRQDPDIILVGEIRDEETAEIAVNAALTGHLLLSTFHANDAATAIPRLLDMGSEPFLLASTLELLFAQRLVRRICEQCRVSMETDPKDLPLPHAVSKHHFGSEKLTLYMGKGCDACAHTGYKGRIAVFEFIEMTPELQELVLKRPSTKEIAELARKQGSRSMFKDGVEKVKAGITTLDELLRVVEAPTHTS